MDGGDHPAVDHWWHPAGYGSSFVHMFGGSDDPLELVRDGGGGGGRGATERGLQSCPAAIPERGLPPSEDVMAAWLYPIVAGGKDSAVDDRAKEPAMAIGTMMTTESSKGKLPATDVMFGAPKDTNSSEKKKASTSTKGSAAHNAAEKRRRCRIAEKLRTLQQLVPGCDHKSSKASTLDQTIQYMRWLQQQVQSMSTSRQASATASAYPVVQAPPAATLAIPMPPAATFRPGVVPMVPFGAMLAYPHYRALMMPAAASAAPLYSPAQAGASVAAPDAAGDHAQTRSALFPRSSSNISVRSKGEETVIETGMGRWNRGQESFFHLIED